MAQGTAPSLSSVVSPEMIDPNVPPGAGSTASQGAAPAQSSVKSRLKAAYLQNTGLKDRLRAAYREPPAERGVVKYGKEYAKGVYRGGLGTTGQALQATENVAVGMESLFDWMGVDGESKRKAMVVVRGFTDNPTAGGVWLSKLGTWLQNASQGPTLAADEEYQESLGGAAKTGLWVGEAVGSALPFAAASVAGGTPAVAMLGASAGTTGMRQEADAAGVTGGKKLLSMVSGAAIGASEVALGPERYLAGFGKVLRGLPKGTRGKVAQSFAWVAAKGGSGELFEETIQNMAEEATRDAFFRSDATRRDLAEYFNEIPLEIIQRQGIPAAIVGAFLSGTSHAMQRSIERGDPEAAAAAQEGSAEGDTAEPEAPDSIFMQPAVEQADTDAHQPLLAVLAEKNAKPLQFAKLTPEMQADVELAKRMRANVVLVESQDGSLLDYPGVYAQGRMLVDARIPTSERRLAIVLHELTHDLAARAPESFASYMRAVTKLKGADLERLTKAYQQTREQLGEQFESDVATPEGVPLSEEGVAMLSEEMVRSLTLAWSDPQALAKRLRSDRAFYEVVRDWVIKVARALGLRADVPIATAEKVSERDAARLAFLFKEAVQASLTVPAVSIIGKGAAVSDKSRAGLEATESVAPPTEQGAASATTTEAPVGVSTGEPGAAPTTSKRGVAEETDPRMMTAAEIADRQQGMERFAAGKPRTTGIKNRTVDAERALLGLEPARHGEATTDVAEHAKALERFQADLLVGGQRPLIEELASTNRMHTQQEALLIGMEQVRLVNERQAAQKAFVADPSEENQARIDRVRADYALAGEVATSSGTPLAQAFRARRFMLAMDYSLAQMELEASVANAGKPLTSVQEAEIREMHQQIDDLTKQFDEYEAKRGAAESEAQLKAVVAEIEQKIKRKPKRADAQAVLAEQANEARARIKARGGAFAVSRAWQRAVDHFGTTTDPLKAGYIGPDGTMLDFSGGGHGRVLDHSDISAAVSGSLPRGQAASTRVVNTFVQRTGAIRLVMDRYSGRVTNASEPEEMGIQAAGQITAEQRSVILAALDSLAETGTVRIELADVKSAPDAEGFQANSLWSKHIEPADRLRVARALTELNAAAKRIGGAAFAVASQDDADVSIKAKFAVRPQVSEPSVDQAIIGADYLAKGVVSFADWSKAMVAELGEGVQASLARVYTHAAEILEAASRGRKRATVAKRIASNPLARAFAQLARRQSRYMGNKREFIVKHAGVLANLAEHNLKDVETVFDMYAGGGTYGLTFVAAGAVPNAKRVVVNEVDDLRRAKFELASRVGGDFMAAWDLDPELRALKAQLEPLIVKSATPAATVMDVLRKEDLFASLSNESKVAFQALRDVMFSGRTAEWEKLRETATEDADRVKRLVLRAQARGVQVDVTAMDAFGQEARAAVVGGGRSLVLLDPSYHETTSGNYSTGDRTYDLGSTEVMQINVNAAYGMSAGNVVVYHNKATSGVAAATDAAFGSKLFKAQWARGKDQAEFVGIFDGQGEGVDVGSLGRDVQPDRGAEGVGAGSQVVGAAASDTGGSAGEGSDRDLAGAGSPVAVAGLIEERLQAGASLSDLQSHVTKLTEQFIEDGLVEREPLIDAVHGVLQSVDPSVTRQQAIDAGRLKGYKTRAANTIAKLTEKMAAEDFAKPPQRQPIPLDEEGIQLKTDVEQARRDYASALERYRRAHRTRGEVAVDAAKEGVDFVANVRTSLDYSAVLRQGAMFALDPWNWKATLVQHVPKMIQAGASARSALEIETKIKDSPHYDFAKKSGVEFTGYGETFARHEENLRSRLANKVPGLAGSNRAFVTFLNLQRMSAFENFVNSLAGTPTAEQGKAFARMVNNATGRGNPGKFAAEVNAASRLIWSPRLLLSRIQLLTDAARLAVPVNSAIAPDAEVRKIIAKQYARSLIGLGTVYALAMLVGADEPEKDPRSADFGKIRLDDYRLDPLAGLSQITVLVGRLATGEFKSSTTGAVTQIRGDVPFGRPDASEVATRFLRNKLAPIPAVAWDVVAGENVLGQQTTPVSVAKNLLMPMSFGNIYDAMKAEGVPAKVAFSILSTFGWGLQRYGARDEKPEMKVEALR